jgi:hypothetical protein
VYTLKADLDLQWTTSASLTCITGIRSCDELRSIPIPDAASWFHWPGIGLNTIDLNQTKVEVILKLDGNIVYNKSIPFTQKSYYDRWSLSPYHDVLLFANSNVSPDVVWNVYQGRGKVATLTENAVMITEGDAYQFGVSLAGTGRLQAYNAILPTPLATNFGFVDQRYALLALEDDTMSSEDQALYRSQGVPPLTNADILNLPVDSIPPKDDTFGRIQVPVNPKNVQKPSRAREQPSVTYRQSMLTIQLNSEASKASSEAVIEIFSLSGKLLYTIKNAKMINGMINCRLPLMTGSSQKMVIVKVRCGRVCFSRAVSM